MDSFIQGKKMAWSARKPSIRKGERGACELGFWVDFLPLGSVAVRTTSTKEEGWHQACTTYTQNITQHHSH